MLNIYYNSLSITWEYWSNVPMIDELTNQMDKNGFNWRINEWNRYIEMYYGLNILVQWSAPTYYCKLQFYIKSDMELFMLHFL